MEKMPTCVNRALQMFSEEIAIAKFKVCEWLPLKHFLLHFPKLHIAQNCTCLSFLNFEQIAAQEQCDKIGQLLKGLDDKLYYKNSPNIS